MPIPSPIPLPEQRGESFAALVAVMRRLLAPDGCPWDREQTPSSLRKYVLEEACEVIDAIDSGDAQALCEELGDLALQVVFLAELGRDQGFGPDDVARGICDKLVRRHPHVFDTADASTPEDVERQWEEIKAREKPGRSGLLDRVPRSLPALTRAAQLSERASRVGFDWPEAQGSRDKVGEELAELDEALATGTPEQIEAELGDTLFALVNLARHAGVDPNAALQKTCNRFVERFSDLERRVQRQHGDWPRSDAGKATRGIPLETLEAFWQQAKEQERKR